MVHLSSSYFYVNCFRFNPNVLVYFFMSKMMFPNHDSTNKRCYHLITAGIYLEDSVRIHLSTRDNNIEYKKIKRQTVVHQLLRNKNASSPFDTSRSFTKDIEFKWQQFSFEATRLTVNTKAFVPLDGLYSQTKKNTTGVIFHFSTVWSNNSTEIEWKKCSLEVEGTNWKELSWKEPGHLEQRLYDLWLGTSQLS